MALDGLRSRVGPTLEFHYPASLNSAWNCDSENRFETRLSRTTGVKESSGTQGVAEQVGHPSSP